MSPTPPSRAGGAALRVLEGGWLGPLRHPDRRIDSPNFDQRPAGVHPDLLVVHSISLPAGRYGGDAVERLFMNRLDAPAGIALAHLRGVRVSAHLFLARDGALTQFVSCDARAWHAGASSFDGRERCNDFSIGVELEGCDADPFPDAQYRRLREIIDALLPAYPLRAIRGHCEIAPGRKSDPGPLFDWSRIDRDIVHKR
jgi:AmpD protein